MEQGQQMTPVLVALALWVGVGLVAAAAVHEAAAARQDRDPLPPAVVGMCWPIVAVGLLVGLPLVMLFGAACRAVRPAVRRLVVAQEPPIPPARTVSEGRDA